MIREAATADGATSALASVHHDGSGRYVVPVGGGSHDRYRVGDEVRLRLRAAHDAPVERVFLRTAPDGEQRFDALQEVVPGPACRWWEATIRLRMPSTRYRFLVVGAAGHHWLNGSGIHSERTTDADDFRLVAGFDPPAWLADRVFYQVFPDRFANGDPSNDVPTGAWTYRGHPARHRDWDEPPSDAPGHLVDFYGGDLIGLEARLDHLVELGVNAIYLNPVFETRSNHGYDTIDYDHVAAHLGGDVALVSLRDAARQRDIRLILDIAPNHTGVEHPWFVSAREDAGAPTAGRYTFHRRPDDYESWLGVRSLPKLDYRDPALREAMYAGPDAILRSWLRPPFSADGWRIDVANMLGRHGTVQLGEEVARGMRAAVKAENPEAYLLGEHSFDATDQLQGDQWDAVMNYAGFMGPVLDWLRGPEHWVHGEGIVATAGPQATADVVRGLAAFRAAVPWAVARCQYNLLDSHDTARIRSAVDDDDGRLRAAFGLLLGYVGVPAILYGDEVGLRGGAGQASRRTMPWDRRQWDMDLLAFVRTLVGCRRTSQALQAGGFQVLETGADWLAFLRDTDDEQVVVLVVRGPGSRPDEPLRVEHGAVADGTRFASLFGAASATVERGRLRVGATPPGVAMWTARS